MRGVWKKGGRSSGCGGESNTGEMRHHLGRDMAFIEVGDAGVAVVEEGGADGGVEFPDFVVEGEVVAEGGEGGVFFEGDEVGGEGGWWHGVLRDEGVGGEEGWKDLRWLCLWLFGDFSVRVCV